LFGQKYNQHFTTSNGLPSNEVYSAFQDKNGCMWFATDRGLCHYNGYEFRQFTTRDGLTDVTVFEFFPQENGQVWCTTLNNKLFYFENGSATFMPYRYNTKIDSFLKNTYPNTFLIRNLVVDNQGTLHLTNGFVCFSVNVHGGLNTVQQLIDGNKKDIPLFLKNITVAANQHIGYLSASPSAISLPGKPGEVKKIIYFNQDSAILIGQNYACLFKHGAPAVKIDYSTTPFINGGLWGKHSFWVSSRSDGVQVYDFNGNKINHDLPRGIVTNLVRSSEGGLWVTTTDAGVYYLPENYFHKCAAETDVIHSLSADAEKNLYIGTYSGSIWIKNAATAARRLYQPAIPNPALVQFFPQKKCVVSYGGGNLFPGNRSAPIPVHGIVKMSDDNDTDLHLLGVNFCSWLNGDSVKKLIQPGFRLHDVSAADGKLYLATTDGLTIRENGRMYSRKEELFQCRINDIDHVGQTGTMYMATLGNGVLVYHKEKNTVYAIDKAAGLSSDLVTEIYVEDAQTIWACTNYGLNRIRFSGEKQYKIDYITTANGLESNQVTDVEVIDDTIYIGTPAGLYALAKTGFESVLAKRNYFLRLKKVLVNDEILPVTSGQLDLPYNQNRLEFIVEAVSFTSGNTLSYRYKLEGLDAHWKISGERKITYEYLPPGTYKLLVTVLEDGRSFSNEQIVMHIIVRKPFWKTTWFLLLLFSSLGAIVYFFFKIKVFSYNKDMVRELLRLLVKKFKKGEHQYSFKEGGKEIRVETSSILYVQSSGNYIKLVTTGKTYMVREKLGDFIAGTPDPLDFLRVHRSYIVRIDKIQEKTRKSVIIGQVEIPVGETYLSELDKILF
ncbi:MAG: LytTR family transcriptional regulator DNA-binding domain-containing protein, partial [Dinghuibacter sp.]|nr:LytTR family transcriptional regulator DNA-binding domain-containing protein [Dinghuibacter sp.]